MIKINLLESVTERPTGVAMVEERVTNPRAQTFLLGFTVFGLLAVGLAYDYTSTNSAYAEAKQELENQRRINMEMQTVNKERAELERKAQDIQVRIDAIKKLRESQQGPGAVLQEIKQRFDQVPGLYLKSLEQKDGEITITGESPNEYAVTKFGQSLEFSSGLFTNLNIETQREVLQGAASAASSTSTSPTEAEIPKPEVITFTVKCTYSGSKSPSAGAGTQPVNQVAMKGN